MTPETWNRCRWRLLPTGAQFLQVSHHSGVFTLDTRMKTADGTYFIYLMLYQHTLVNTCGTLSVKMYESDCCIAISIRVCTDLWSFLIKSLVSCQWSLFLMWTSYSQMVLFTWS